MKYIVEDNGDFNNGQLISAGSDHTLKMFDLAYNE